MLTAKQVRGMFTSEPSYSTILRWANHGVKIGGRVIKLECEREGWQVFFTAEHVAEFKRRLNNREG